jgi:hypothetical protein
MNAKKPMQMQVDPNGLESRRPEIRTRPRWSKTVALRTNDERPPDDPEQPKQEPPA